VSAVSVDYIDFLSDSRLEDYRDVRDKQLLRDRSLFIVEGRENVRRLIRDSSHEPRSVLLSKPAFAAMADFLAQLSDEIPVFVGAREVVNSIAGFDLHRGCLAAVDLKPNPEPASVLAPPGDRSLVVVLEALANPDNVGGVFRNAMALGVDAVLLSPRCCDPLYRKAIRVSMGAALCVPTARFDSWPAGLEELRAAGYRIVALHPSQDAEEIGTPAWSAQVQSLSRMALVLGTEGKGLSAEALSRCDERHRIAMVPGFDSLNVATACGIALHHLFVARVGNA
jgi:tRNA G18 (ribose-2'-O)-methylase SpoU